MNLISQEHSWLLQRHLCVCLSLTHTHCLILILEYGFPDGSVVKNLPAMQEPQEMGVQSLGWEDPLEEEMTTHSSILAWSPSNRSATPLFSPACWELGFQAWAQSTCPELSAQGLVPLRWGCQYSCLENPMDRGACPGDLPNPGIGLRD